MKRFMKQLIPSLLGSFLVLSMVTPVNAEQKSGMLPLSGTVKGELTETDANQVYDLILTEAGRLKIDMTSFVSKRAYVQLVDSYNETIYSRSLYGNQQTPARDVTTIDLEKGTYQFMVYDDYGSDDLGTYSITTQFTPMKTNDREPNNGTAQAQDLAFGKMTKGYLSKQDNKDVYRVKLTKAGRLSFDFSSSIEARAYFQLTDEYNESIFSNRVYASWNNPGKYTPYIDLEPGTYYVNIYDDYGYDDTGTYELKSTFVPALNQEVEPNNGTAEAKTFPFYQTRTGFLSWNDSVDVYKIVVPKTSRIGIDITSYVSNRAVVGLYDDENNEVVGKYLYGSSKAPVRYKENVTLTRGTYYLSVRDDYGRDDTGKYKVRVTSSHLLPTVTVNQVTARSTKVSGKTEKGATVTMTIGKKSYKRTADAKGNYSFSISKQKAGTSIKISSKNKYGSSVKTMKVSK